VFFFGGGFEKGDPTKELHSPDYFMMRDVVVVTVSYRVGPLGFLSLNDPSAHLSVLGVQNHCVTRGEPVLLHLVANQPE